MIRSKNYGKLLKTSFFYAHKRVEARKFTKSEGEKMLKRKDMYTNANRN